MFQSSLKVAFRLSAPGKQHAQRSQTHLLVPVPWMVAAEVSGLLSHKMRVSHSPKRWPMRNTMMNILQLMLLQPSYWRSCKSFPPL